MSAEAEKWILEHSIQLLQWLGVTSVAGFIALYSAWLAFPPEIVIEAISDKSKRLNSESAIKIRNSGKLPALKIETEIDQLNATIGNIEMKNCTVKNSPNVVPKLSGGESTEISVSPAIATEHGVELLAFSYLLRVSYHARLFLIKKTFSKTWKVELRTFEDGFAWKTTIVK